MTRKILQPKVPTVLVDNRISSSNSTLATQIRTKVNRLTGQKPLIIPNGWTTGIFPNILVFSGSNYVWKSKQAVPDSSKQSLCGFA